MAKRNLKQILAAGMIAAGALLPIKNVNAGGLTIFNGTTTPNVVSREVLFRDDLILGTPFIESNSSNPGFEIFCKGSTTNYSTVGIKSLTNGVPQTYTNPLAYHKTVTNGTSNVIKFYTSFAGLPSNTLISAKIVDGAYTNAIDVKKSIFDNVGTATFDISPAAGGTNMQEYGTVFVKFVPLNENTKGKIKSIQRGVPGGSTTPYTITADIPNGTSNTIYRSSSPGTSTNSANVVTNFYANVTDENFERGTDTYAITDNVSNNVDRAFWFIGEKVAY